MNAVSSSQARHQRSCVSFCRRRQERTERTTDEREDGYLGEVGEEEHGDDDSDCCESCFEEGREHRLKQFGVCARCRCQLSRKYHWTTARDLRLSR
jgi:hypothetical protein